MRLPGPPQTTTIAENLLQADDRIVPESKDSGQDNRWQEIATDPHQVFLVESDNRSDDRLREMSDFLQQTIGSDDRGRGHDERRLPR